jgi:hypothetical protein
MTPDDLEDRLAQLRADWPVQSIVEDVMARIGIAPHDRVTSRSRRLWRGRFVAAVAASGLLACVALTWLVIASGPQTLQAAVQGSLAKANSAHLVITNYENQGKTTRADVWYRRGEGLRAESPDEVLVDDGKFQWSWRLGAGSDREPIVLRQPASRSLLAGQIGHLLALPDIPVDLTRSRAPELDREVNKMPWLAYILTLPERDPNLPPGAKRADARPYRHILLADVNERIHEISAQRQEDGRWATLREIRIEYDVPVPHERIALRLPESARLIDPDTAFNERHPLEAALFQVELGGLLLAVHDVRPLVEGGCFVVSSVRGTPEFLRNNPPRRRPVNPKISILEVAEQPIGPVQMHSYVRIVLALAEREGVQYAWWLIVPRRFFQMKDGKRIEVETVPLGEPARLDDLPGRMRLPLTASYRDTRRRDARGWPETVSKWVEVPLPADHVPTSLEDVAGRTRRDLLGMRYGSSFALLGVPDGIPFRPRDLRPVMHFEPNRVTDAEYAAAIRRGIDDYRSLDETWDVAPPNGVPTSGTTPSR